MKRNMELIREILQKLEDQGTFGGEIGAKSFPNYSAEEVSHHIAIMYDANLIDARESKKGLSGKWVARRLKWEGHDFLDAAKNETVWNKAKEEVKKKGGMFSIEILKKILSKFTMDIVFAELNT